MKNAQSMIAIRAAVLAHDLAARLCTAQLQSAEAEIATMRRTMAAARDIVDRVLGSGLEEALAALGFQLGMDQASRVRGGARTLTRCS